MESTSELEEDCSAFCARDGKDIVVEGCYCGHVSSRGDFDLFIDDFILFEFVAIAVLVWATVVGRIIVSHVCVVGLWMNGVVDSTVGLRDGYSCVVM